MKKKAVYGGSFNPPGRHHRDIAEAAVAYFERVVVIPCGFRKDKPDASAISDGDRKELVMLNFSGIKDIDFDFFDLENGIFTPTWGIENRYRKKAEVWHVVGPDLIQGGGNGFAEIQTSWQRGKELWANLNFAVVLPSNCKIANGDLPPNNFIIRMKPLNGRSSLIRRIITEGGNIEGLVLPSVAEKINQKKYYRKH
jgi:nicotinic acid mononucleotide adenylyltransferase